MINAKFMGKHYKIYSNGRIKCLDEVSQTEMNQLKDIVQTITNLYRGPEYGFPVSKMAHELPNFGVEVTSYRDYEMENALPDTVY